MRAATVSRASVSLTLALSLAFTLALAFAFALTLALALPLTFSVTLSLPLTFSLTLSLTITVCALLTLSSGLPFASILCSRGLACARFSCIASDGVLKRRDLFSGLTSEALALENVLQFFEFASDLVEGRVCACDITLLQLLGSIA